MLKSVSTAGSGASSEMGTDLISEDRKRDKGTDWGAQIKVRGGGDLRQESRKGYGEIGDSTLR